MERADFCRSTAITASDARVLSGVNRPKVAEDRGVKVAEILKVAKELSMAHSGSHDLIFLRGNLQNSTQTS